MKDSKFLPRPAGLAKGLLDPDDSVICLLDHQAGLFQTVFSRSNSARGA